MKKIIAMAIAALFFISGINAQLRRIQDSSFEKKHIQRKTMIKDHWNNLNLTADQKEKIKENQESLKSQRQAIQKDASLTDEQKKSKMMDLQKSSREKNAGILTADQTATLKANQKKNRTDKGMKGQKGMKGKRGMKGSQSIKGGQAMKGMDLTQDQQAKMKVIRSKMQSQSTVIKNNSSLTEDQKKQQIQELRKSNMAQMNQVLTPEQKLKLKNRQGKMKEKVENKQS